MEQKIFYRELLGEILQMADAKGGVLTRDEVEEFFAHTGLTQEHIDMICEYLVNQKVRVEGFESTDQGQKIFEEPAAEPEGTAGENTEAGVTDISEKPDAQRESERQTQDQSEQAEPVSEDEEGEHRSSLEQYLEDLDALTRPDARTELQLFQTLTEGGPGRAEARERLTETYLPLICELAGEYEGSDITAEDLIQEGNIGLLMALDGMEKMDSLAAYQAALLNAINQSMKKAIGQQKDTHDMDAASVKKVNRLNEAIRSLTEELEHTVSIGELSVYLDMPAEEIRDILKLAGDEIKIDQSW